MQLMGFVWISYIVNTCIYVYINICYVCIYIYRPVICDS